MRFEPFILGSLQSKALLVAVIALLSFYLFAFLKRNKNAKQPPTIFSQIPRLITILLLLLAALGPYYTKEEKTGSGLALIDISESIEAAAGERLLTLLNDYKEMGLELNVIPFALNPGEIQKFETDFSFLKLQRDSARLQIGGSNIEAGLLEALQSAPQNVFLLSDGNETSGNALQASAQLKQAGFRIFPLIPQEAALTKASQQLQLTQLNAPLIVSAQKSADIRATVKNSTSSAQVGTIELMHAQKSIKKEQITIDAGKEYVLSAASDPLQEGIQEVTATFVPENQQYGSSSQTIFLASQAREKVLLLSGSAEDSPKLEEVLTQQSYQLKSLKGNLKAVELPKLEEFSTVVLNNIPAEQIPSSYLAEMERFTNLGGGLIMVGGNKSFGLGGYIGTAIEKALPVQMLPPETIKKRVNVAVSLVLDKSRSMADASKLDFAKEAAREAVRALKDDDFASVIGFDASPFVVVEMSNVGINRDKILDRVGRLFPAGRTNLLPAIDEARRGLLRANAGRKHMIILTDGKIPDEGPFYIELVKQMRIMGITVSTVLLGGDADPGMLRTMADQGGGAFYQTVDPRSLPRIFLTDLKVSTGEQTLKESAEFLVRQGTGELVSTEIRSFPPLRGYVQTKPRENANLELVAFGMNKAEPLLASWGYGKGKALAFTSDATGRWANQWVAWPRFGTFWTNLIDWVHKSNEVDSATRFDVRTAVERDTLSVDISIYSQKTPSKIKAELTLPNGQKRELELSALSAGHYQSKVPAALAGRYDLLLSIDNAPLAPVAFNVSGSLFGEQKGQGFNTPLLYALANQSGGKVNPSREEVQAQSYVKIQKVSLAPIFIALALLCFFAEIILREFGFRLPAFKYQMNLSKNA